MKKLFGYYRIIEFDVFDIPQGKGSGRNAAKEFIQFLYISLGSAYELETHLIISR
ncbi:four helix bundle protein [Deferribacteraceae bacterium V6Fe1]|nr:four helix bundle protein [Deferribacteraceae bacterium V6Fe1]